MRKRQLTPSAGPRQATVRAEVPAVSPHAPVQRAMQRFTCTPTAAQRQAVIPVLRAASLRQQEEEHLRAQRLPLQRQVAELRADLPADAIQTALQRQASERSLTAVPAHPQTAGEWVTVMRHRAEQMDGRRMDARSTQAFTALQRQVTAALVHSVKHDPSSAIQRQAAFAEHAVGLQRHALTRHIPRAALTQLPPGERLSLQRAVDEATQAVALQRQQDAQALQLHSLQRQLADLDEQATKPVMERIQARRGSGNPLPAAVQRHLEQGLNHDLSAVRIHDDAEADKLAKGVNATAFTTGTDIYFRSGTFNPNTQSGLELLAHEVTHTVQQSQGKVGKGIDPDAGLEAEARAMGKTLAQNMRRPLSIKQSPASMGPIVSGLGLMQRQKDGSGKHGIQRPGLTMLARKQLLYGLAIAADQKGYVNAARHLRHYLGNSGTKIKVDVEEMLSQIKGFNSFVKSQADKWTSYLSKEIANARPGVKKQLKVPRNYAVRAYQGLSPDWFFAVGSFTNWITGEALKTSSSEIQIDYRIHVWDYYNWDQNKWTTLISGKVLGEFRALQLPDTFLGDLHRAGIAKEFEVEGVSKIRKIKIPLKRTENP